MQDDPIPAFPEGMVRAYYGTPDGEEKLIDPTGSVSDSELYSTSRASEVRERLPVAVLDLLNSIHPSTSLSEADDALIAFKVNPPESARGIPEYLLDQAAIQHIYYSTDLLFAPLDDGELEIAAKYARVLGLSNYPNPEPVAFLLSVTSDRLDRSELASIAEAAHDASADFEARMSGVIRECDDCKSDSFAPHPPRSAGFEWNPSQQALVQFADR
ncbi:MAG: hypothetical protein AAGK21_11370 [Bacteroidota bacterium]